MCTQCIYIWLMVVSSFPSSLESGVVPPASLTVTIGQNVTYTCSGKALLILWTHDGVLPDIKPTMADLNGFVTSNLTLPLHLESMPVQCMLVQYNRPLLLLPQLTLSGSSPLYTLVVAPCTFVDESVLKAPGNAGIFVPSSIINVVGLPPVMIASSEMEFSNELPSFYKYVVYLSASNIPVAEEEDKQGDVADKSVPSLTGMTMNEKVSTKCQAVQLHSPLSPFFISDSNPLPPQSTNVTVGEEATFTCTAEGVLQIAWTVNNILVNNLDGIPEPHNELLEDGRVESILTVPGSPEYDNISIQCVLIFTTEEPHGLKPVYLTVLGITPVQFLSSPDSTIVQWEKPMFVSNDVKDLMYNVSISGPDLLAFTNTTSETKYNLELSPCQEYIVTVTPFSTSPAYIGGNTSIANITPGEYYKFQEPCQLIDVVFSTTHPSRVNSSFYCKLASFLPACPHQSLKIVTNPLYAESDSIIPPVFSPIWLTSQEDIVVVNVTGLPAEEKMSSTFFIVNSDGKITNTTTKAAHFSTYSVQDTCVSQPIDSVSVEVVCIFALHAPATGCLVVFESGAIHVPSFNVSVPHSPTGSLDSSMLANIPQQILQQAYLQGMTSAFFNIKVYDIHASEGSKIMGSPALEQRHHLELGSKGPHSSVASTATSAASDSTEKPNGAACTLACIIPVVVVVVVVFVAVVSLILYCWHKKIMCRKDTVDQGPEPVAKIPLVSRMSNIFNWLKREIASASDGSKTSVL